jgi:Trk K+ transport system NAD-binding subunit
VPVMGVDFDPVALGHVEQLGVPTLYGDAEDPDLPGTLPLSCAEWIVSTSPAVDTSLALLDALRAHRVGAKIAVTAHTRTAAEALEDAGADLLLRPFIDAGDQAVRALGYEPPVHSA